ncbi:hypothetical protein OROMI_024221 [Orobanche minor]
MYHKRGLWAIEEEHGGKFPVHEKAAAAATVVDKPPKFYLAYDIKKPLSNKRKPRPTKLSKCPYKINGVPLRRVNQAYVTGTRGNSTVKLEWGVMYKIALGAAKGLQCLHEGCQRRINQRCIKAVDILLSEEFEAKIHDFGIAKWLPESWTHHTISQFEGTFGGSSLGGWNGRPHDIIDDDSGLRMRPMTGMIDMKSSMSMDKKAPGRASETKRTRRIPEEMEKIMFKLSERQPNGKDHV